MAASSSTPVGSTVNKKLATQVSGPSLGASIGPPNSKKKKKSKANVKGLLKAPVCLDETWASVSEEVNYLILTKLKESLESANVGKRGKGARGGKKVQSKKDRAQSENDAECKSKHVNTLLRFGVNSVMRAAEKDDCSLVVINRDAQPRVLTEHLLELVKRKRIPCASITRLSEISEVTGIQAVTAIGFKPLDQLKDSDILHSAVVEILNKLSSSTHKSNLVDIPPLDLSQDGEESEHLWSEPMAKRKRPVMPPDDLDYTTLYVYKEKESKSWMSADFLQFSASEPVEPVLTKGKRYMDIPKYISTTVGRMKSDPNRKKT